MRELEEKVSALTRKLTEAGSQNFEMRQLLDEKLVIEEELQSTKTLLHKLSKENKELNEKLKSMQSYDDVVEENTRLRKDVHTLRENSEQNARIMSDMERRQREYKLAEEANSLKISELRHALGILNDRVGNLNTERAYLRSQLNIARTKSVAKNGGRSQPRINDPLEENYQGHSHGRRRNDEICSSCVSSEDDSDIEGIRNRLARLDTIARGLNAQMPSSDASSAWDRMHANEPTKNETYDDYCRNQSLYSDAGRMEYPRTSTPNENTRRDGGPISKQTRFTSTKDASLNNVELGVTQSETERRRHEDTALRSSGRLTDDGGGETSKNVPESFPSEENEKEKKEDEEETGNVSVAQENSLMGQYMALLRKSATEETENATQKEVREMIPPHSVSDDGIEDVIVSVDKPADGDSEFEW